MGSALSSNKPCVGQSSPSRSAPVSSASRSRNSARASTRQQASPLQASFMQRSEEASSADYATFADDDAVAEGQRMASIAAQQPEPEVSSTGAVALSTRIEYTTLACGSKQDVFGLVTLQASETSVADLAQKHTEEERQPLDIICVLDVSGSMSGDKLRLVQDAVRFVVRESRPMDRLSLVAFNHQARRPLRLRRMDTCGKDEATSATLRLTAGGGTNIASGVEMAIEIAERRRCRNPVSAILLLTDGQDGSSGPRLSTLLGRAQRAGCAVYPFGFGSDHDARMLSSLAEQAQTPFTFVEDVEQIGAAFAGAIGGLASVAAQQVEVVLECRVPLKAVHTPFSVTTDGDRTMVQIPDMLAGERRDVLVELVAPQAARCEEMLLLEASARYWDLAAKAVVQVPALPMRAQRIADEEQPEQEPDEEVATQRCRVEVALTLKDAAAHGDEGRFEEAQAALQAQEQRLRTGKQRLSPIAQGLAAELQDARNRMQSRASWESGGYAEVHDAMQMHMCQRTTNMSASVGVVQKRSKAMYCTAKQSSWISKSG